MFIDAILNGALLREAVRGARGGETQDEMELIDSSFSGSSQESRRIKGGNRGFAELMKQFFVNTWEDIFAVYFQYKRLSLRGYAFESHHVHASARPSSGAGR